MFVGLAWINDSRVDGFGASGGFEQKSSGAVSARLSVFESRRMHRVHDE